MNSENIWLLVIIGLLILAIAILLYKESTNSNISKDPNKLIVETVYFLPGENPLKISQLTRDNNINISGLVYTSEGIWMIANKPDELMNLLHDNHIGFTKNDALVIKELPPIPGSFNKLVEQLLPIVPEYIFQTETGDLVLGIPPSLLDISFRKLNNYINN